MTYAWDKQEIYLVTGETQYAGTLFNNDQFLNTWVVHAGLNHLVNCKSRWGLDRSHSLVDIFSQALGHVVFMFGKVWKFFISSVFCRVLVRHYDCLSAHSEKCYLRTTECCWTNGAFRIGLLLYMSEKSPSACHQVALPQKNNAVTRLSAVPELSQD